MSTVAEQLRHAREAQKLTVEKIAEITKIRTDHLRALESGDYEVFSAPVYVRGFVRTYSTLLKLDVAKIMAALDGEMAGSRKFAEPMSYSHRKGGIIDRLMLQVSRLNSRSAVALAGGIVVVVIFGGAYYMWKHYRPADPLSHLEPGMYRPAAGGQTLPLPQNQKK